MVRAFADSNIGGLDVCAEIRAGLMAGQMFEQSKYVLEELATTFSRRLRVLDSNGDAESDLTVEKEIF
jgi:uncharacterized membrane protein